MIAQHFYAVLLMFGCIASFITLHEKNKNNTVKHENIIDDDDDDFNSTEEISRSNDLNDTLFDLDDFYKYERFFVEGKTDAKTTTDKNLANKRNVYIQGLFELETRKGPRLEGYSEILAAKLAIDHVNKFEILPGISLKLLVNDTKCDIGVGLDRLFHTFYSNKTIIMVLTGSCSAVSEAVANVVPFWNVLQISYASNSPNLSDRKKFPLFFRTIGITSSQNNARVAFIKYFKWETIVLLSENHEHFLLPLNNFVKELESNNISCASSITFSKENLIEQLKYLKELEVKVIIGSFSSTIASEVFCEAYTLEMFGSDYVWILQEEINEWWDQWQGNKVCAYKNLLIVSDGIILVANQNDPPEVSSVYNLKTEDFLKDLNKTKNATISHLASLVYDAIWTMAFTIREAIDTYHISPLNFTYKNKEQVEIFLKIMKKMRFMGISGPVIFKGADRIGNTVFKQLKRGQINPVAIFNPLSNSLDFSCKFCKSLHWKGDKVPIARRILRKRLEAIPKLAFYTVLTISCIGILLSSIFLYFNLHFRQMRTVKLSSPYMNNTAIIGCITVYLAVSILGMDSTFLPSKRGFSYLCMTRVYLLSAGFSLTFGSLFAKTYRIHRIFTYSRTSFIKDKLLKDKPLIALVCLLLLIDGIIIILWSLVDPMKYHLYDLPIEISSTNTGIAYQPQVEICKSENTLGWFTAMYGYKGILLMMVVYMAWETRRVKIPELNDSQYIGICVYSVLASTLVIILSNFIPNHPTMRYLTISISILVSTTIIVFLLLLPKLKSILRQSKDPIDPIEKSMGLKTECNTRRFLVDDPKDLIYRLEAQNKVYRNEIQLLDQEINRLEKQLTNTSKTSNISTLGLFMKRKRESCCENSSSSSMTWKTNTTAGRASWPTTSTAVTYQEKDKTTENCLPPNSTGAMLYDQMKKLLGNISLVWHFNAEETDDDRVEVNNGDTSKDNLSSSVMKDFTNNDEETWLFNVSSAVQYSHENVKYGSRSSENEEQILSKERY